jgi:hypothetical protein
MLTSFFKSLTCVGSLWSRPFAQLSLFAFPFWFRLVRLRVPWQVNAQNSRTPPNTHVQLTVGIRPAKIGVYYAQAVSRFDGESTPASLPLTQTVSRLAALEGEKGDG